jgi:hypothetical protein
MKNYRLKYKLYYDIDFDKDYVIHHIDFDRTNNDISNLLLLPKGLHTKYHILLNALGANKGITDLKLNNMQLIEYNFVMFEQLPQVINECSKWLRWRNCKYDTYLKHFIFNGKEEFGG